MEKTQINPAPTAVGAGVLTLEIVGVGLLSNNCTIGKHIGMNKSEIIDSIAYVGIPSETTLIEHSDPALGITVASINRFDADGLQILATRLFADQLKDDTADLPEIPDAALFYRFHTAVLAFHRTQLGDCLYEEIKADILSSHQAIVAKIRQIASKLEITYQEPEDHLLD